MGLEDNADENTIIIETKVVDGKRFSLTPEDRLIIDLELTSELRDREYDTISKITNTNGEIIIYAERKGEKGKIKIR